MASTNTSPQQQFAPQMAPQQQFAPHMAATQHHNQPPQQQTYVPPPHSYQNQPFQKYSTQQRIQNMPPQQNFGQQNYGNQGGHT